MAAPRLSVVLVVGAVLLATGGAAYYFFAVFSSDERLRVAREQVATWEERWQQARTCLLGKAPLAATFADAITGREITPDSASEALGDCSGELGKLTRPEGNNTGMDGVEAAWLLIEQHAIAAAKSYVMHLQAPDRERGFFAALEALALARGELRRQVELSPEDGAMGPAPRQPAFAPLALEGQALTELLTHPEGAAQVGGAVAGERALAVTVQRSGTGGITVAGKPVKPGVVVAYPELTWGAAAGASLLTGPLAADGSISPAVVAIKGGAKDRSVHPRVALGEGAARAVLYDGDEGLQAAISTDGGATWKSQLITVEGGFIAPSNAAVADVTWSALAAPGAEPASAAGAAREPAPSTLASWLRVDAATLPALAAPVTVPVDALLRSCPAPTAPWLLVRGEGDLAVLRMDAPAAASEKLPEHLTTILDCDDDAVLLGGERGPLWACRAGECQRFPWLTASGLGAVVAGRPMAISLRRDLAAVMTDDASAPPALLRVPEGAALYGLYALAGAPYLVIKNAKGELSGALLK
jgi:hypothetical protein